MTEKDVGKDVSGVIHSRMEKYPGPWVVVDHAGPVAVQCANGETIVSATSGGDLEFGSPYAMNMLVSVPGVIDELEKNLAESMKERDELLAALKALAARCAYLEEFVNEPMEFPENTSRDVDDSAGELQAAHALIARTDKP